MKEISAPAPEQKEKAKHGEQMFPLQQYITELSDSYPAVTAHWHEEAGIYADRGGKLRSIRRICSPIPSSRRSSFFSRR